MFLDLNSNLRKTIKDNLKIHDNKINIDSIIFAGLVQTSLMCQDVLAKHLGTSDKWIDELLDTVAELIEISKYILNSLKNVNDDELVCEYLKILGSTYLCSGTIVTVLGPRCLPHLSVSSSFYCLIYSLIIIFRH